VNDLFDLLDYPDRPGHRNTDTSVAGAVAMAGKAPLLRERVIDALRKHGPLTTFEIAARTGASYRAIQPRTSELRARGKINDSGARRRDPETGKLAIVWEITNG
jgi:hypothetical protein